MTTNDDLTAYISIETLELNNETSSSAPSPFPGDPTATWTYWTDTDTADRGIPEEWVWERLRLRRNTLLAACDWRVIADAPWEMVPWLAYRQALRDLPEASKDPRLAVWPDAPAA